MATRVSEIQIGNLGRLRYKPIDKQIRGTLARGTVVDTRRARQACAYNAPTGRSGPGRSGDGARV